MENNKIEKNEDKNIKIYKYRDRKKYNKEYHLANKEKLLEQIICPDCGGTYQKYNKCSHVKTKKHKNSLEIKKLKNDIDILKTAFTEISKKIENI